MPILSISRQIYQPIIIAEILPNVLFIRIFFTPPIRQKFFKSNGFSASIIRHDFHIFVFFVSREGFEPHQALKPSFLLVAANLCLKYVTVRLRKSSSQPPKKYGFKVLRILTAINLGKSRQTNAIILAFNADFANFAPLKLMWFNSLSA